MLFRSLWDDALEAALDPGVLAAAAAAAEEDAEGDMAAAAGHMVQDTPSARAGRAAGMAHKQERRPAVAEHRPAPVVGRPVPVVGRPVPVVGKPAAVVGRAAAGRKEHRPAGAAGTAYRVVEALDGEQQR